MTIDDIALTMQPRLGPKSITHLLSCMGSAAAIYEATAEELIVRCELNPAIAADLVQRRYHRAAHKELGYMERHGIQALASTDSRYPALLKECGDNPHVLYYIGDVETLGRPMLSVVGTRNITSYGARICDKIIGALAEMIPDLVIISGLAYGVDGAAHRAALNSGLRTAAILANALPTIYPSEHSTLASQMLKNGGALISEYRSDINTRGKGFVPRNRIIAGLSPATLVVESPLKGGSMITANIADGYNRNVMAVPGRIEDNASEGTNFLIKSNKARMVASAEDIIREMMWDIKLPKSPTTCDSTILSKESIGLLALIAPGEAISHDDILEKSGMTISEIAPLLLELEFEGLISQLPGKIYEKV